MFKCTQFITFASVLCLSFEDIYAGKICAALDRQHPRDLFDIKLLLENKGITDKLRKAFLIYLVSNNRPISELLAPNLLDFKDIYNEEFIDMTNIPVSYEDLLKVREKLIVMINNDMTDMERQFLFSIKTREPMWELMNLDGIHTLPAIQWKLQNIKKMDHKMHAKAVQILKKTLKL